jgi:hypothetical protein
VEIRHGRALATDHLPAPVRRRLADLDRLHEVWSARRRHQPGDTVAEGRDALLRRHVRELRAAAAAPADPARERAEADALIATAAVWRAGERLTADYLGGLARSLPDLDPPVPGAPDTGAVLAAAAAVEAHPVVRAAHLLLTGAEELRRAERAAPAADRPAGPEPLLRPLPWALATLSLMRSGYPPLALDHRLAGPQRTGPAADPFVRAVGLLADMAAAAMRAGLSRPARSTGPAPPRPTSLAVALHRRLLDHLRDRSDSLRMVFREIEPDARIAVAAGTADSAAAREHCDAAAQRVLVTPGPGCWWASIDVDLDGGMLRLLVSVHDVGAPPSGVLAVTADAWLTTDDGAADVLDPACTDCVTLLPTDCAGERWPQVEAFADDAVARAVGHLTAALR